VLQPALLVGLILFLKLSMFLGDLKFIQWWRFILCFCGLCPCHVVITNWVIMVLFPMA